MEEGKKSRRRRKIAAYSVIGGTREGREESTQSLISSSSSFLSHLLDGRKSRDSLFLAADLDLENNKKSLLVYV